jgi:GTPase Era involved in 16S rRNA processing
VASSTWWLSIKFSFATTISGFLCEIAERQKHKAAIFSGESKEHKTSKIRSISNSSNGNIQEWSDATRKSKATGALTFRSDSITDPAPAWLITRSAASTSSANDTL